MMQQALLYVHGKGGSAAEAEHYRTLCEGYAVFGADYRGDTPWDTKDELAAAYDALAERYRSVTLVANSIGAFFAMNALQGRQIERALFISPVVDMEKLISDMMRRENVTERELEQKREIETPSGETLSWRYLRYVRENPIRWEARTHILYGGRDFLTPYDTIAAFAARTGATLTVMENGEHWFHTAEQMAFLDTWFRRHLFL